MNVISRKEAKHKGFKHYFTGKSCKNGHVEQRYTGNGTCIRCSYEQEVNWRKQNPDLIKLSRKKRYKKRIRKTLSALERQKRRILSLAKYRNTNIDKIKKIKRKYNKSLIGRLRSICQRTYKSLNSGKLNKSKLYLIDYSPQEYRKHILENLSEFGSIQQAYDNNYHLDHVVPISFISKHISNKLLAFKICMSLYNLRLIPSEKNLRKGKGITLPIVQETIILLNTKYNVNMPLL